MVPLRTLRAKMEELYSTLPTVRWFLARVNKSLREGALDLGLRKQWNAVAVQEARIDALADRAVPQPEFEAAVSALEASYRNLLNAMNETIPGSQGSLL